MKKKALQKTITDKKREEILKDLDYARKYSVRQIKRNGRIEPPLKLKWANCLAYISQVQSKILNELKLEDIVGKKVTLEDLFKDLKF